MVIGYQQDIISYKWLQRLLLVINKLLIVMNGYCLSTGYHWLSMVINGYQ